MLKTFKSLRHTLPLIAVLLFSSCATIFNSRTITTNIHTYPDHAQVVINSKDTFCCNVETFSVKRSGYPLEIKVKKDSIEKTVYVKPLLSSTYVFANLPNCWMYGGGYWIDVASPKRFTYPSDIYINLNNDEMNYSTSTHYKTSNKYETGADNQLINLVFHVPLINGYDYSVGGQLSPYYGDSPPWGPYYDTIKGGHFGGIGYLGFCGSMEYHLNKQYYLSGTLGYYTKVGYFEREYRYMSLTINKRISRFNIGAGLAWVRYNYSNAPDYSGLSFPFNNSKNNNPYGYDYTHGYALRLDAQYQLTDNWYIATNVQPLLIRDNGSDGNNINFWGLELNYKLPLLKRDWVLEGSKGK